MASLQGMGNRVLMAGQHVLHKIKGLVQSVKLKIQMTRLQRQIEKEFNEIGKEYFLLHHEDAEQALKSFVEKIKGFYDQVEQIKRQLDEERKMPEPPEKIPNAGNGQNVTASQISRGNGQNGATFSRSKRIAVAVSAIAAVVVIGVVAHHLLGGGPEKAVKKYVQSIQKEDGALRTSLYAPDYIDYMVGSGSFYATEKSFIADMQDECEDDHQYFQDRVGENLKLKYEVLNKEKMDKEELEDFNRVLASWYDFEKNSVKSCYKVYFQVVAYGEDDVDTFSRECYIMKIKGKWYIQRGYIGDDYDI